MGAMTTVFDAIRPTVVVRRRVRVIDVTPPAPAAPDPADEAPPSSVFLHPGYNILEPDDEDEDEEVEAEDEAAPAPPAAAAPEPPRRPEVTLARDATLGEAAKALGVTPANVIAELVSRGLFQIRPTTTISDEVQRVIEETYARTIVLGPPRPVDAPKPKAKAKVKAKATPNATTTAKGRSTAKRSSGPVSGTKKKTTARPTRRSR
jgi:hypothetical protein